MIYEVSVYDDVSEKWGGWSHTTIGGIKSLHGGTVYGAMPTVNAVKDLVSSAAFYETKVEGVSRRFRARKGKG